MRPTKQSGTNEIDKSFGRGQSLNMQSVWI